MNLTLAFPSYMKCLTGICNKCIWGTVMVQRSRDYTEHGKNDIFVQH
jgi:hypothetical protein